MSGGLYKKEDYFMNPIEDPLTGELIDLPIGEGFRKKLNRDKANAPKRGFFWCNACDAQVVSTWKKCPNCGHRNNKWRHKK